jgi:hypothetical protein
MNPCHCWQINLVRWIYFLNFLVYNGYLWLWLASLFQSKLFLILYMSLWRTRSKYIPPRNDSIFSTSNHAVFSPIFSLWLQFYSVLFLKHSCKSASLRTTVWTCVFYQRWQMVWWLIYQTFFELFIFLFSLHFQLFLYVVIIKPDFTHKRSVAFSSDEWFEVLQDAVDYKWIVFITYH